MSETRYIISDAAKIINVEPHVLRYWEEELGMDIPRNEMGHRYYTDKEVRLFSQVRDLKEKGFQLKAIKMILSTFSEDAPASNIISLDKVRTGYGRETSRQEPERELSGQEPERELSGQEPEHELPVQNPERELPGQEPERELPGQNPEREFPRQNPERELPRQNPGREMLRQEPVREMLRQTPGRAQMAAVPESSEAFSNPESLPAGSTAIRRTQAASNAGEIMPDIPEASVAEAVGAEDKMKHFKYIMDGIVMQALKKNNQMLEELVAGKVIKEMDYMFRAQEEKDEERFRSLDEAIRKKQKAEKKPRPRGWHRTQSQKTDGDFLEERSVLSIKKPCKKLQGFFVPVNDYSWEIAPVGQAAAQLPQSKHSSALISNLPSPSLIAPTGHSPAQLPQEMQSSEITYAIGITSL